MKGQGLLRKREGLKALAEKLSESPEVTRYDREDSKEAWNLAFAFGYLEASFRAFLENHLPRLEGAASSPEVYDALLDIGDEFREILYHMRALRFYRHLYESPADSGSRQGP